MIHVGHLTVADLKGIRSAFWEAHTEWKNTGIELSLLITDLDEITINGGGNVGNCFTDMLTLWLKQADPPPIYTRR